MNFINMAQPTQTRRRTLSVLSAGTIAAVAGCLGSDDPDDETMDSNDTATSDDSIETSYEVCMDPRGCLSFDEVPETWICNDGIYAEMGIALGVQEGLVGIGEPHRGYTGYLDELPGVSYDLQDSPELATDRSADIELFYELDVDIHIIDPLRMEHTFGLDRDDIDRIEDDIAPFFGSYLRHQNHDWQEEETYYTLIEGFELFAEIFQRTDRFEQFNALYNSFLDDIQSRIPETGPEVLLVRAIGDEPDEFFPRYIDDTNNFVKRWRNLNAQDALEGSGIPEWGTRLDYETLAELDPDIIVAEGQHYDDIVMDHDRFDDVLVSHMKDNPLADDISAIRDGRVYPGGINYEGPITLLFQTEMAATQLYPDEFGDETLFDREELANIITGDE